MLPLRRAILLSIVLLVVIILIIKDIDFTADDIKQMVSVQPVIQKNHSNLTSNFHKNVSLNNATVYDNQQTSPYLATLRNQSHIPLHLQKNVSLINTTIRNNQQNTDAELDLNELLNEIGKLIIGGNPETRFFKLMKQIALPTFSKFLTSETQMIKDGTICVICNSLINALLQFYNLSKSAQDLQNLIHLLCVELQLEPANVCAGAINLNMDTIIYILNNTDGLTSSKICGIVLQSSGCSVNDPSLEWTIDFDFGSKPNVNKHDIENTEEDPLTIVHVTDIHHDPAYTVDGNALCREPLCCRNTQEKPKRPEALAGHWGDYRKCDLSWHGFENALQQIKTTHKKIDYIYMTGDIVDHAVWDTSVEKNTKTIKKVLKRIKDEFPNIPVFPILGNHDPSPVNQYAPVNITDQSLSINWLYELVANEWSMWLPQETKETIIQGGFYTVLVRPGFRIIGLNNNVCYILNWWLLYDAKDPVGQLKWLAETLLQAEINGEKVHILGHIPPGENSCQKTWSREYRKIINRFEETVTAQFNGHTHNDEFEIFYSLSNPSHAINVAFNGGSLTQYDNLNSNYKIYNMNASNYEILEGETWIFNLTEANNYSNESMPKWFKLYSYKEAYGMKSLSPSHFDKLVHQMASDKSLLQKYARYFMKDADSSGSCNDDCLKNKLCNTVVSQVGDTLQCNKLLEEYLSG